jgi:hypothetical protein
MQQHICRYPSIHPANGPDNPWGYTNSHSEMRCFVGKEVSLSLKSNPYTVNERRLYNCYNIMAVGLAPKIDLCWLLDAYTKEFKDDAIVKMHTMLMGFVYAVNCIQKYPIFNKQNAEKNTNKAVLCIYYQSFAPHMDDDTVKQYTLDLGNLPPEPQPATVPHITAPTGCQQLPPPCQQPRVNQPKWFDPQRMFSSRQPHTEEDGTTQPEDGAKPKIVPSHPTPHPITEPTTTADHSANNPTQTLLMAGLTLFTVATLVSAVYAACQAASSDESLAPRGYEL